MTHLVKESLSMSHYDFMKAFLNDSAMAEQVDRIRSYPEHGKLYKDSLTALNHQFNAALKVLQGRLNEQNEAFLKDARLKALLNSNLLKIQRVLEILEEPRKKTLYDKALAFDPASSSAGIKIKLSTFPIKSSSDAGDYLVSLVPLAQIKALFLTFVEDLRKRWPKNSATPFPEALFSAQIISGPPKQLDLTFPDVDALMQFNQLLFGRNMAILPGGSQNMKNISSSRPSSLSKKVEPVAADKKSPVQNIKSVLHANKKADPLIAPSHDGVLKPIPPTK